MLNQISLTLAVTFALFLAFVEKNNLKLFFLSELMLFLFGVRYRLLFIPHVLLKARIYILIKRFLSFLLLFSFFNVPTILLCCRL